MAHMPLQEAAVGDVIVVRLPSGYDGHNARVRVVRSEAKVLHCVECDESYKPGQQWRIERAFEHAHISKS